MDRRKLNQENKEEKDNKKKLFILLGVLALLVVVGSVIAIKNRNNKQIEETPKETVLETKEEQKKDKVAKVKEVKEKDLESAGEEAINKIEEEIKKAEAEGKDVNVDEIINRVLESETNKVVDASADKVKSSKKNIDQYQLNAVRANASKRLSSIVKENISKSKTINSNAKVAEQAKKAVERTEKKAAETQKEAERKVEEKRKETKKEVAKETRRETKPVTPSKPVETRKETQRETKKKDVITTKRITETESIPYNTIDRYASTGAESRVEVAGRNGVKTYTIEITYKNGVEVSRKTIGSEVTSNPKDEVIARYINEPKQVEKTIEVEDKSRPIIDYTNRRDRWFVRYRDESVKYFYNEREAYDEYQNNSSKVFNWGTAEPEYDEEIIGYETITKTITETVDNYVWRY